MVQFEYPELILLAIPVLWVYWRWGHVRGATGWLRLAILVVLLLALTGPRLNLSGRGIDVIVVADRSRSLSPEAHANIRELVTNLQQHVATDPASGAGSGHRLGLITFASEPHVEFELSNQSRQPEFIKEVNPDGSDLHAAILAALDRVNPNRPARILVLSDGEANGQDPSSAARRAREANVPVDCRVFERLKVGDVAVESVHLPESVGPRDPFQYTVRVHADREVAGIVRILREGRLIAEQNHVFRRGLNPLLFRDVLEDGGFYNYSVEVVTENDPIAENNRGAGLVRVDSGPRVLVLNSDGADDNLVRALRSGKVPVEVAAAASHPLSQDALDPFRAVILENVPADSLGRLKMERLAQYVEDLGGGLLLTGGERSFGTGGYFKSPLEDVLPVSMELREEHRKMRVAIAIALDRSGSMAIPVKGNKAKMDLANLGTAECIKMLSPQDMVAVIAVDSSPHVIQSLRHVDAPESITSKVLKIESMGGGIFVYEALVAAGQELMKADGYATRHIILFSDAADSEQPGDYVNLLKKYSGANITVSVIGLGTPSDSDARLLEDIAKLGRGNIMFTDDAEELPRLFTQDTMSIARSTFVTKDPDTQPDGIEGAPLPAARLMGSLGIGAFPNIDGYNLSYLKPGATPAVVSRDEYKAPWSAAWYRGLGRAAAITLEVDGQYSGAFGKWNGYEDFLVTHARWLLGSTDPTQVFAKVELAGQDARVLVELDPDRPNQDEAQPPELIVVPPGEERSNAIRPDFVWTGPHTLEARFRLEKPGSYRTLVKTGPQNVTRGPAVTLPYSAEFAPRIGMPEGADVLKRIVELSRGQLRTDVLDVFDDPPRTARTFSLLAPLMVCGLALLVLEIAGRRLALWERLVDLAVSKDDARSAAAPELQQKRRWSIAWRLPRRAVPAEPSVQSSAAPPQKQTSPQAQPSPAATTASIFEQAKKRARRRME